jgi:hypothetical protein
MTPDSLPPVIALNGVAGSGKDEAARALIPLGYQRVSFADSLRRAVEALDPIVDWRARRPVRVSMLLTQAPGDTWGARWEHVKRTTPEVRRTLIRMGTEVGRNIIGPDTWVDIAMRDLPPLAVLTDCRFENEAHAAKTRGGIVMRIDRPGVGPVTNHVSETALDTWPFDARILNDGSIADLHAKILAVLGAPVPV